MQTHESLVCVDAPPADGERAAAAMALAIRLREELLGEPSRKETAGRQPLYRLVHHLAADRSGDGGEVRMAGTSSHQGHVQRDEDQRARSRRYIVLATEDVKRLRRLAHLLSSLSGELNLLLAGIQHGDEEVEP